MRISAIVIAKDEAARIARCLESLRWTDEIVVVIDDRTTDDTAAIARRFTDRVLEHRFATYAEQHNWADRHATGDWILSVDCDEVVPPALAAEIREVLRSPRHDAYRVPHQDYMFGRWIRYGGWYPQYHLRLYRQGAGDWGRLVHEAIGFDGPTGALVHPILHFAHLRVTHWVDKMARYTTLEAEAMQRAGRRTSILRILVEPPLYAGYKYFVQQGWRDGAHGLVLALLLGAYRMVRNLKLWDLQQAARGCDPVDAPPPPRRP